MNSLSMSQGQRGMALPFALLMLLLMTMIGVSAMNQTILEERMAGGLRNTSLANNGAESALRWAERVLHDFHLRSNGRALVGDANGSDGVHKVRASFTEAFRGDPDWSTAGQIYGCIPGGACTGSFDLSTTSASGARLAQNPRFVIEDLGRLLPAGAGKKREGGGSGTENYGNEDGGNHGVNIYRITSRSTGGSQDVVRLLESTFTLPPKG